MFASVVFIFVFQY